MLFILQRENQDLDVDVLTLKEELKSQKLTHQYVEMSLGELKSFDLKNINAKKAVPVGSLDFVREFLRKAYGIPKMSAIEIPKELRKEHLLRRNYQILNNEDVEKIQDEKFIKYASELKTFSYWGSIPKYTKNNSLLSGLYVVSDLVHFSAEYRIFVLKDKIQGVQFYDGVPTCLLSSENLKKIQEMIVRYSINETRPKAYTLDVGILEDGNVAIIEIHPWCSVGLYGCFGGFLPEAYIEGFKWYVKHNTPLVSDNPKKSAEEILAEIFGKN